MNGWVVRHVIRAGTHRVIVTGVLVAARPR
jgi:hypothetical protein